MNIALLMFVLTVVAIVLTAWWALCFRTRKATPTGADVLPAMCAKCDMFPTITKYEPEEPLGNCIALTCPACGPDAAWHGRSLPNLVEEWNETQRIARGGKGETKDTDA